MNVNYLYTEHLDTILLYGFNGMEKDDEWLGGAVSFKFRVYDSRICKFLSVDPLASDYCWNSTYAFAENQVIWAIDLEGLEKYIIHQRSFSPWPKFGGFDWLGDYSPWFHGDPRGFSLSTDKSTTSRVNRNSRLI